MQAVVLAGGRGTRLHPFTVSFPKPLVPIGDRPVLEVLLTGLRSDGVDRLVLAVGHLAPLIESYFQDGSRWGVRIEYHREDQPLGTAGPLGTIPDLDPEFLVVNGDLLTDLSFQALVRHHQSTGAAVTVARHQVDHQVSLGVLEVDEEGRLVGYREKPVIRYWVSMGAYVFRREVVREFVPPGQRLDLPDLLQQVVAAGRPVQTYAHPGTWMDIGRPEDYAAAQDLFQRNPDLFLRPPREPVG